MSEWKERRLDDLVKFQRGHDLTQLEMIRGEYPVAGSNGIIDYHNEYTTKGPGITLGRSGNSIGVAHYYKNNFWAHNTTLYSKEFIDANPLFVYFFLQTIDFKTLNSGSAVPSLNRNHIHNIIVKVPLLPEQTAIASVLSSLDNKIDLLHRQNATLEKMAETLFRQWFVERESLNYDSNDFYDGNEFKNQGNQPNQKNQGSDNVEEAKEEWETMSLSQMANFLNGLACQKFPPKNEIDKLPVLKIKELSSGITENSDWASTDIKPEYIVKNGDVIFAWSASLMVKIWDGQDCILNQHLFKVTSEDYPKWFYYLWCKHHLAEFISIAASHATTMGHVKRGDLDEAKVLIPSPEELEIMTEQLEPIIEKIITNTNQIRTLTALRDTLLPKLMSGEVRVL
jgi:type I restriction enzyme S subunit